jgi:hypothetical protein
MEAKATPPQRSPWPVTGRTSSRDSPAMHPPKPTLRAGWQGLDDPRGSPRVKTAEIHTEQRFSKMMI